MWHSNHNSRLRFLAQTFSKHDSKKETDLPDIIADGPNTAGFFTSFGEVDHVQLTQLTELNDTMRVTWNTFLLLKTISQLLASFLLVLQMLETTFGRSSQHDT